MSLSGEEETTECSTTRSVAAWCRSAPRWLCSRSWWSRQNYADYQRYTCSAEQSTEANMFGAQQESVRQHGARYVDDVTAVTIDGDRALKYLYEREIPLREGPQRQRQHPADVCKAGRAVEGLFGVPVTPCGRLTT